MMNADAARDAHHAERGDERRQPHEHDQRRVSSPDTSPIASPAATPARAASRLRRTGGRVTTPASAITAPGARSMPPEMITTAAPTAAMP